MTFIERRNVLK